MLELTDIQNAAARLQGQLLNTPCVASKTLSEITGAQVFLKFENLQFTASFKERGACSFASKMGPLAGNHFLTIAGQRDALRELGRKVLWEGAQEVTFALAG